MKLAIGDHLLQVINILWLHIQNVIHNSVVFDVPNVYSEIIRAQKLLSIRAKAHRIYVILVGISEEAAEFSFPTFVCDLASGEHEFTF